MPAKHAQKPSNNQGQSKRRRSSLTQTSTTYGSSTQGMAIAPAETFKPLQLIPHEPQSLVPDDTELTPLAFFSLFWNDYILSQIAQATNAYADHKRQGKLGKGWSHPVSTTELQKFLGITIMMEVIRLSNRSQYWRQDRMVGKNTLSFRQYRQIKRYIHISMPEATANSRGSRTESPWWTKLEPLHSHSKHQSQTYFQPSTHVAVDEMMVRFTGRSKHTVRIPSKPIPVGYKVIALCHNG